MMQRKNPRIYVLEGAAASGKTTLLERLARLQDSDIFLVPEAARKFYQENDVPKEERSSYQTQVRILQNFQAELQKAVDAKPKIIITDSSPLSCIVYSMLGQNLETTQKLSQHVEQILPQYTEFFILNPSDVKYRFDPSDAIRKESSDQRFQVHENLLKVMSSFQLPHRVIGGTVEERLHQILATV